jgi:hypothetical protein
MGTVSSHFQETPHTRTGRWSLWLAGVFVVMFLINSFILMPTSGDAPWRHVILPFYGIVMLLCGLSSMVLALVALIRGHERSWLIFLPLLPGVWVLFMLVGEFLFPH